MTLTIDIGNTRVKWVLYQDSVILRDGAFEYTLETFREVVCSAKMPLKDVEVVIANVSGLKIEQLLAEILDTSGCIKYVFAQSLHEQCGVTNSYDEFSQLGVDRWLAMIAGYNHDKRLPEESICVIDCGTAVTFDVVDTRGFHLGGVIAPGFQLMRSMLLQSAKGISGLSKSKDVSSMCLAKTTDEAVDQGCAQLLIGGLDAMISRYSSSQPSNMRCFVTGGDGAWVADLLEMEALFVPTLVNEGLRCISREM